MIVSEEHCALITHIGWDAQVSGLELYDYDLKCRNERLQFGILLRLFKARQRGELMFTPEDVEEGRRVNVLLGNNKRAKARPLL